MTQTVSLENRYQQRFERLFQEQRKAFMPFTLLGWPDSPRCLDMVKIMIQSGVTALELGFPFSDPMADGPIIQQASTDVLKQGFQVADGLTLLRDIRAMDETIPMGVLVYYNLVLARGVDRFFSNLSEAGVDGILIPDLPPESVDEVMESARSHGIALIFIVSPLTEAERLKRILSCAGGFLYVVSRLGITGTEEHYDANLEVLLKRVKPVTQLPLCVGFGISTPDHAQRILRLGADGVITGSRILQIIQEDLMNFESRLKAYLASMMAVCNAPPKPGQVNKR